MITIVRKSKEQFYEDWDDEEYSCDNCDNCFEELESKEEEGALWEICIEIDCWPSIHLCDDCIKLMREKIDRLRLLVI